MAYDNPQSRSYSFAVTADKTIAVRGPSGKNGIVREIQNAATTAYTAPGDGAEGSIQVGVTGTLGGYASVGMGTTADGDAAFANTVATGLVDGHEVAADTDILITYTHPTGTGAAGAGQVNVAIDWF